MIFEAYMDQPPCGTARSGAAGIRGVVGPREGPMLVNVHALLRFRDHPPDMPSDSSLLISLDPHLIFHLLLDHITHIHALHQGREMCLSPHELPSQLLVSPLITPQFIIPYLIPYITPLQGV